MQKTFTSTEHDRTVKWIEGGRIIHCDLAGRVLAVEDYSKSAISKILKFFERGAAAKPMKVATFNAAAQEVLRDIEGFEVDFADGKITARATSREKSTNKVFRGADTRYNSKYENTILYTRKGDGFAENTRYSVVFHSDGLVEFEEFEKISCENLNVRHDQPLLSVYVTEG
jgi:hypothetical protein